MSKSTGEKIVGAIAIIAGVIGSALVGKKINDNKKNK